MSWKREPILMPPVVLRENSDGTLSWPSAIFPGCYHVVHDPAKDIPPAYLCPPSKWVWVED